MTVAEIMEQIQEELTLEEQEELANLLTDSLKTHKQVKQEESEKHWGKNVLALLDKYGPVELDFPEIEDPVEWVKRIREQDMADRNLDWGEDE